MSLDRRKALALGAGTAAAALVTTRGEALASTGRSVPGDDRLARSLPGGFRSHHANVNGTRLHYVAGGKGDPLILVPGWPATWWSYRKVMPALARHYRVIVVDIRGMGGSDKPQGGFDKKTMARDIYELVRKLGYRSVNIAGHDIGAMVAFSFAANHAAATRKVALLDVLHPDEDLYTMPMLQPPGGDINMWWFAFNQVPVLPEQLIAGRARYLIDWHYGIGLVDQSNVADADRAVFAHAYDTRDAVRCGNGWYKAIQQDIEDMKGYSKITAPLLGLASPHAYDWFRWTLPKETTDLRGVVRFEALHWLCDEEPQLVIRSLREFFS
ncbi:alpha/beta hydrolase [Actinomadura barringtoniae]|uniref:Alpha/beta hydrolase n=1 Tax=Actinomadura barringtoniae TaxID=1427535 RepID=A0A939T4N4_9ACTN|nr:alpha/beta hydrolase [Actinomadura barringtoniae]MBO2449618.1 alpha/beta hydrolase [Actinomadura barringtoniae]